MDLRATITNYEPAHSTPNHGPSQVIRRGEFSSENGPSRGWATEVRGATGPRALRCDCNGRNVRLV